ncbi:NAD(P)/FAD-dependent oxidoreductase [Capillimicrobium parvum]|nr:FAD-dependent oxidoreductase [Capillimicrobium parvum]
MTAARIAPLRIVIAGGGVAALETLMALHDLGEAQFRLTLVAPREDFVLRAMSVAVPFSAGHVTHVSLDEACAEFGAERRRTGVEAVDAAARRVHCSDGTELDYDVLVLATGAVGRPAYANALTFTDDDPVLIGGLLRDIEQGYCPSLALVVPPSGSWSLPVYELALLIARHAYEAGMELPMHVVTPEPAPLAIFGPPASAAVTELLEQAGITVHTDSYASIEPGGRITLMPGERRLHVARVVALPTVDGRAMPGVPADDHGFVPTDEHGRVIGCAGVYAVGDGANFPVKQGGLAAQQADAAARHIAAGAGAPVEPVPFRPVMRGLLLTGSEPRFMRNPVAGGGGPAQVSDETLWWPPAKVVGHYLAPWLARHAALAGSPRPGRHSIEVEAELPTERHLRPLTIAPDEGRAAHAVGAPKRA